MMISERVGVSEGDRETERQRENQTAQETRPMIVKTNGQMAWHSGMTPYQRWHHWTEQSCENSGVALSSAQIAQGSGARVMAWMGQPGYEQADTEIDRHGSRVSCHSMAADQAEVAG